MATETPETATHSMSPTRYHTTVRRSIDSTTTESATWQVTHPPEYSTSYKPFCTTGQPPDNTTHRNPRGDQMTTHQFTTTDEKPPSITCTDHGTDAGVNCRGREHQSRPAPPRLDQNGTPSDPRESTYGHSQQPHPDQHRSEPQTHPIQRSAGVGYETESRVEDGGCSDACAHVEQS